MKTFFIILAAVGILFILLQSYIVMSSTNTEEQKYSVIEKDNDFEIRLYPSATFATIKSNAKTYKDLSGPGFRKLAGYIFGGNVSETKIAMTAPVHMDLNDTASTMSFVMPSNYSQANLPTPNDTNIILHKSNDEYVAAIRFGGFVSDADLKTQTEKLKRILAEKGINSFGNYRFLGYNPPYQFFGRRNEIIVSIDYKIKSN
jgi:hypothetical protein